MLLLERLDVVGFKSFSDRSSIDFPSGITAVVGPNGCGKSNIADAIQWVLGEQSARALRGQRMEDVIFAGSANRGAGGMAEVTLHLSAREGELPDGRVKVTLTRRLFRTGQSDYLIDGKKARLVDVRGLLDQVRAGVRSYAIIDQGHVASFVTSKPKDRRVFIEEAAGVAGYKARRRSAELKLEATRANLLRVDDILREVERQQRSLKRQASLARRARRLDERLRALRTVWYHRRDRELDASLSRLSEELAVARTETSHLERERERVSEQLRMAREELGLGQSRREEAVEAAHRARLEQERLGREIDAARNEAASLDHESERREDEGQELAAERERRVEESAALENQLAELARTVGDLRERVSEAEARAEAQRKQNEVLVADANRVERELFDAVHKRAEFGARLSAAEEAARREEHRARDAEETGGRLSAARVDADSALAKSRESRDAALREVERLELGVQASQRGEEEAWTALEAARSEESRLTAELRSAEGEKSALDSLEVRLAGSDATREVLEQAREGRLKAQRVIADVLAVDKEVERAAESFLGDVLPTVLVDSGEDVQKGASLGIRGKLRFLPLDAPERGQNGEGALPAEIAEHPGVHGRLAARLRAHEGFGELLGSRLDDAVLVDTLETALELNRRWNQYHYLTPEGHVVYANGLIAIEGGVGAEEEGLLARTRRREELGALAASLREQLERAAEAVEGARTAHRDAQIVRRGLEEDLAEARRSVATARMEVQQAERELDRIAREVELAERAQGSAKSGLEAARAKAEECRRLEAEADQKIAAVREALEAARERAREHESEVREAVSALSELSSDKRALDERRSGLDRERSRLQRELVALDEKSAAGRQARELAKERAEGLREKAKRHEERLGTLREAAETADREVESWGVRLVELDAKVVAIEKRVGVVSEEFEGARARRETYSIEAERAQLALDHEREGCRDELGCEPNELPSEIPAELEPEIVENDGLLQQEIASIKKKRERLGPVNLLAEKEFEELNERYNELSGQRADLMATVDELGNSIRKMNKESRERFLEAYVAIREHFRATYTQLFRGGQADLILENEDDVLETGVEIMCQPPGKKLQSVSLLSGGEKALSATAVLFAIFKFQPPPFCLLDEIDAPLDDTNVHRFTEAVREFAARTQIILITHNKRSMETADVLYGVTMPEPGVSKLVSMTLD